MNTNVLVLSSLCALAAGACASRDAADLGDSRNSVLAKLDRLSRIAAEVDRAPALGERAKLVDPGVRVVLCPYQFAHFDAQNRAGGVDDPGPCNARIIDVSFLLDWRKACARSVGASLDETKACEDPPEWNSIEWYVDMASIAADGSDAFHRDCVVGPNGRRCASGKATRYLTERTLEQFSSTRFVLVTRDQRNQDVFLYDTDGPKALGGFVHRPMGRQSAHRAGMNDALLEQLADVVVYATY